MMNVWTKNVKGREIEGGHDDEKKVLFFFSQIGICKLNWMVTGSRWTLFGGDKNNQYTAYNISSEPDDGKIDPE